MHEHDCATVAVEKGMPMRKVTHHFAGLFTHERLVLTFLQRVVDGFADILGVSEQHRAFPDEKAGCVGETILARPGKDAFKKCFVRMKHVAVSEDWLACEMRESRVDASQERVVLQPLHDGRIFGSGDVAEITPCFEIAKGIKCHRRLSRRYRAWSRTAWIRLRMPARWSATIVFSIGSNATSSPGKR